MIWQARHMPANAVIELRDVDIRRDADIVVHRLSADIVAGRVLAIVSEHTDVTTAIGQVLVGRTEGYRVEGDLVLDGRELVARAGGQDRTQAELFVRAVDSSLQSRETVASLLRDALGAGRKDDVEDVVATLLQRVQVPMDVANRRVTELDHANRLRVSFAVTLAHRPQVVVVDVPYVADASTLFTTYSEVLQDLSRETPIAWVVTTDSLAVAADIADDVMVMLDGRVVEQGSVYDICLRPAMPYTRDLLLVTPRPHRALPDYPAFVDLASHGGCPWVLNCREALTAQCAQLPPALRIVGPGHEAACYLAGQHG